MTDEELQRRRYEAIFRAVARRNLTPLLICLVVTALVCAVLLVATVSFLVQR